MQSEPFKTIIEFCLEKSHEVDIPKRIKLYRGLAEFCGDMQQGADLFRRADELETAERRCREFRFRD